MKQTTVMEIIEQNCDYSKHNITPVLVIQSKQCNIINGTDALHFLT